MTTTKDVAERLTNLLNSPDGRAAGFASAEVIDDPASPVGVEVDGELYFVEVTPA